MSETKLILKWCGKEDTPKFRAAFEHCKVVRMFEAADPKIVTYEEYMALVEKGEVDPPTDYWDVREGQVGVVALRIGSGEQWNMVANCKHDFDAGWDAALSHMKK